MMSRFGYGYRRNSSSGVAYDALAAAYFAAVPNAFDAARKTIINTLIAGLRSDGNLTKLDRLWLLANTTTGNAVIDLIGLNSATLVNAPAFVADQGYTGDGATSYVNSNFSASSDGVNYIQDSASYGIYIRNDSEALDDMSVKSSATIWSYINARYPGGTFYGIINANNNGPNVANTDSRGLFVAERTGASVDRIWKSGILKATTAVSSSGVPSIPFFVGAQNNLGVAARFTAHQYAVAFTGSGTIDQAALYTRIQQYMTDLGTNV